MELTDLGKQCIETMNLLPFFHKSVILCDTAECEFVHEVDLVWSLHVLVLHHKSQ